MLVALVAAVVTTPSYSAERCGTTQKRSKLGGLFGGIASDFLGTQLVGSGLSSTTQRAMRGFLSDAIACSLSQAEQKQAADSQNQSLNGGKIGGASETSWTSKERPGVNGGTKVVSRSKNGGAECAVTTTFVVDEEGKEKTVTKELCQGPDGTWA